MIDPATNRVFVVADTSDGGTIQHKLFGFSLSNGSGVPGYPVDVEPAGDVPKDQLQRPGLALDNGQIINGYGGNDGDCGTYHGWLVAVPEIGGAARTVEVDAGANEGASWGSGNAPTIDSSGSLWVSTGNGDSGSTYGYQESVFKLDASMNLLDHWAPSDWQTLDSSDADMGSSEPVLLPSGLVFEIGKQGLGYLLSATSLGGTGAAPRDQASVCNGSWAGGIYYSSVIYLTYSNGLHALSLNAAAGTFSPLAGWQAPASANGPSIVAGGLVWTTAWNSATLYGLNPRWGNRWSPSPPRPWSTSRLRRPRTGSCSSPPARPSRRTRSPIPRHRYPCRPRRPPRPPAKCTLRLRSNRVKIHHPKKARRDKHAPPAFGTVSLRATCSQNATATLRGLVTEMLGKQPRHGKVRTKSFHLAGVRANLRAGVARTLQLKLTPALLRALERHVHESAAFTLTANGTKRATAHARLRP